VIVVRRKPPVDHRERHARRAQTVIAGDRANALLVLLREKWRSGIRETKGSELGPHTIGALMYGVENGYFKPRGDYPWTWEELRTLDVFLDLQPKCGEIS
jgi:hypothetical protein